MYGSRNLSIIEFRSSKLTESKNAPLVFPILNKSLSALKPPFLRRVDLFVLFFLNRGIGEETKYKSTLLTVEERRRLSAKNGQEELVRDIP